MAPATSRKRQQCQHHRAPCRLCSAHPHRGAFALSSVFLISRFSLYFQHVSMCPLPKKLDPTHESTGSKTVQGCLGHPSSHFLCSSRHPVLSTGTLCICSFPPPSVKRLAYKFTVTLAFLYPLPSPLFSYQGGLIWNNNCPQLHKSEGRIMSAEPASMELGTSRFISLEPCFLGYDMSLLST